MRRRLIAALAALLLAAAGAVVLLAYVRDADARALAGTETVEVLVVQEPVPAGTPAEDLEDSVTTELLPKMAVADGGVADLGDLAGQVTTVDLQPGEQLLGSRFASPDDLAAPGAVAVPDGASEISVLLEPQRAVGGRLAAGDTVGVYVSLKFQDGTAATHAILHGVTVTQVQGASPVSDSGEEGETQTASTGGAAPTAQLMITLAMTAAEAEPVIFGIEHGTVWLSLEPEGADTSGTEVVTQGNVYEKVAE